MERGDNERKFDGEDGKKEDDLDDNGEESNWSWCETLAACLCYSCSCVIKFFDTRGDIGHSPTQTP